MAEFSFTELNEYMHPLQVVEAETWGELVVVSTSVGVIIMGRDAAAHLARGILAILDVHECCQICMDAYGHCCDCRGGKVE